MTNEINNTEDTLDVRDIIARVEELREERDDLTTDVETAVEELDAAAECVRYHHDGELDDLGTDPEHQQYRDDLMACADAREALSDWEEENAAELAELEELLSDLCGYGGDEQWEGDWYPVTLVRDSYFQDYAQELAEDCGFTSGNEWPGRCIDWEQAARELKMDYSTVEFNGVTYWYR
jgi:hypothetical protein